MYKRQPSLWGALALLILAGVGVAGITLQFNEVIPRLTIGIFENSNASVVKNSAPSFVPETLEQPQATLQSQTANPLSALLPQPKVAESKPEAMRSAPKVQNAVMVENPVVLPEITLPNTEQSDEAQSNNR